MACFRILNSMLNTRLFTPGAQMEVDYTEKLNFSDDEDNHTAKEKGDNW